MSKLGLVRIPIYPQLNVFSDNKISTLSICLSVLLYWTARDSNSLFSKAEHGYQLSMHTGIDYKEVIDALDKLCALDLLKEITLTKAQVKKIRKGEAATITCNDLKKTITFLKVDFKTLSLKLKEKGVDLSPKTLTYSASDVFDFYDVIVPALLPLTQSIVGQITGEEFDKAALICAKVATYVVHKDDDFSYKAIAPGWRMLMQEPATYEDIASRWIDEKQRAIDLSFCDGNFFLIDAKQSGANSHYVKHQGKKRGGKILACACLLAIKATCKEVSFISDIALNDMLEAIDLMYEATGLIPILDDNFYKYKELERFDVLNFKETILKKIQSLKTYEQ